MADEFNLATIRDRVRALVQDDAAFITPDELVEFIDQAILQVNKDNPHSIAFDITGDNGNTYELPTDKYQKGFSTVETVEMPAGEVPPRFIDRNDDWIEYEDPSKAVGSQNRLLFVAIVPQTSQTIRITTSDRHTVTETTSTFHQNQFLGAVYFAVFAKFRALAGKFGQTAEPAIEADSVDYQNRSQSFLFISERYESLYRKVIGLSSDVKADFAMADVDTKYRSGENNIFRLPREDGANR